MTWQSLTKSLEEAIEYVRYIDLHGDDQIVAMSPLTCAIPELGTFLKMDDTTLIDVLVDMWDGQKSELGAPDQDGR